MVFYKDAAPTALLPDGHHRPALNQGESNQIRVNPTFEIRIACASVFVFVSLIEWLRTEKRSKAEGQESKSVKHSQGCLGLKVAS